MSRLTQTQGKRLCELAHLFRPEWDVPGIEAAVRSVPGTVSGLEVARALLALADNPEARTPGLLPKPGRHWPTSTDGTSVLPLSHDMPCPEHPAQVHPCPTCKAEKTPPTDDAMAELRKAVADAKTAAPRPRVPAHHQPATDLDTARTRADQEANA